MKIRIVSIFITLLISMVLSKSAKAQISYFNTDTLGFEYEGPIIQHYNIVVNQLFKISNCTQKSLKTIYYKGRSISEAPLISSLFTRLTKHVEEKQRSLNYIEICDFLSYYGKVSAYFEVIYHFWLNTPNYVLDYALNEKKDEQFIKLVTEACNKGVKVASTSNGFYDKELAKKIARAILLNNIKKLLSSNEELAYRIIKIADYYTALRVIDSSPSSDLFKTMEDKILQIILNRKNLAE